MKTPSFGKVTVEVSDNKKKGKFNLSHDNNTSFDWGSVQPVLSQLMLPDSSINVNMEQLTRLAPMPVPTFGRVKMKNVVHFVSIRDIFPNFDYFLAKKPISRPNGSSTFTFVPNVLPHVNNSLLTAFALAGAKFNLYYQDVTPPSPEDVGKWYCLSGNAPQVDAVRAFARYFFGSSSGNYFIGNPNISISSLNYTGYCISFWKFTKGSRTRGLAMDDPGDDFFVIPSITTLDTNLIDTGSGVANGFTHSFARTEYETPDGISHVDDPISFDGSDLIWESEVTEASRAAGSGSVWAGFGNSFFDGKRVRITIQLSSFGKRLHKVLVGLGYNFSLNDDSEVSILPLLAYYKAYWDTYAPERVKNFYQTSAWKLIQMHEDGNVQCDMTSFMNDSSLGGEMRNQFKKFMFELGSLFATDRMDVLSAATDEMVDAQLSQSSDIYNQIRDVMSDYYSSVAGAGYSQEDMSISLRGLGRVGALPILTANSSQPMLTQPQLDALKAAYTYVNKYSVAGQNLAAILRMNGLGKYVEECQGKFVAASEDTIKISDVVATAGTADAKLGQYGGRGLGASADQFSFDTDRHGYLIMLSCIVPESGYVNSPDLVNEVFERENFFEAEFDGFNYEALPKKSLGGSKQIQLHEDDSCNSTFGYLPTFSTWKFRSNIANGDFSLFSRKNATRPYTLDKHITIDEVNVIDVSVDDVGTQIVRTTPKMSYSDVPNAGEDYRYIAKMPWNGDYNRMFTADDDGIEWQVMSNASNSDGYLYNSFEYDNFQTHFIFSVTYWAPMKEIEDSYSTYDVDDVASRGGISRS